MTAFALSVAVLALGGLPPLAGFMSKWQIFVAGFETRNTGVELLVIFAALNSVLSLAYYAPLVNRMYRNEPSPVVAARQAGDRSCMGAPLVVLTPPSWCSASGRAWWTGSPAPPAVHLVSIFAGVPARPRM